MNAVMMRLDDAPLQAGQRWHPVCRIEDIPVLGARVLDPAALSAGRLVVPIAIFRNSADQVFALDDRCPHKGGPLSQGIVFGTSVACPLHNWTIALDDGQAAAPDVGCTLAHPLRAVDGQVFIALESGDGSAT